MFPRRIQLDLYKIEAAGVTGRSTNGRSRDFESLCLGSNPSRPTRQPVVRGETGIVRDFGLRLNQGGGRSEKHVGPKS